MATVEKDFEELLKLFNKHGVRYCLVGAFAFGFHARPRYTKDLDLLVEPTLENGQCIVEALREFGFGSLELTANDFSRTGRLIQLGYEPVRVDLITSITGVNFQSVWKNKKFGLLGHVKAPFIGLKELTRAKRASGRKQDLADLEILMETSKRKKRR